jgi:hypothetical protein
VDCSSTRSPSPPSPATPRRCTHGSATTGRTLELGRAPTFRPTEEGRLLGHVQLGIRLIESRAEGLDRGVLAEFVHAVAVHHDARAARTAEAAVLYHANQLDAVAATRPVPD